VVNELLAQASWLDGITEIGHWRTRGGDEVDLVIEDYDGRLVAFEVKAGGRVRSEDLKGLRSLRRLADKDFVAGVVLYTGQYGYRAEDGIYVAPIDRLWT